jgi:hypothetical protein
MQHFLQVYSILTLAAVCSTSTAYLVSVLIRKREIRLILWICLSQILSTVAGYYVNTQSMSFVLQWIRYLSFYYYSFSLLLISQWSTVDHMICHGNVKNATISLCYEDTGDDVLNWFNISQSDSTVCWTMLATLLIVCHFISCFILRLKFKK